LGTEGVYPPRYRKGTGDFRTSSGTTQAIDAESAAEKRHQTDVKACSYRQIATSAATSPSRTGTNAIRRDELAKNGSEQAST